MSDISKVKRFFGLKEKKQKFSEFPAALRMKIVKMLLWPPLFIFGGTFVVSMSKTTEKDSAIMILFSIFLALLFCLLTYTTYRSIAAADYEVYEGVCISNSLGNGTGKKVWNSYKKIRTIQIDGDDGMAYRIVCKESGSIVRPGYRVKVYVPTADKPMLKDGEYVIYSYYGIESIGKKTDK